mmetsp:Transcript_5935/g.8923  ORF Transcript_5935/g.8923 Transcript_5935/m.8923 type:complete len:103 (+) Transcript_5935:155-463(+)|eukprot:CAMPEP_0171454116 /NCGR_PEP_ID=MMETSP0945-20130129/1537_1 /TAXON_ID=109269 /ORGANISM="Vaucheria litorea, Strain CCMP2940" /LENGTH=102 /DNA_ID=CAMNT_0011979087 /DNA_START=138 /DNA_END=446 /DNA_ORIENTATION=+
MSESTSSGNILLDLILQPGSSLKLVPVINVTLVLLLIVIVLLQIYGDSNVHFTIMGFLAVGLLGSVNWFIAEFNVAKRKREAEERENMRNENDSSSIEKKDD